MCWEKEGEYYECYDHVWGIQNPYVKDDPEDIKNEQKRPYTQFYLTVAGALELEGNIRFTEEGNCRESFFNLLTSWHEKGWIKPNKKRVKEQTERVI